MTYSCRNCKYLHKNGYNNEFFECELATGCYDVNNFDVPERCELKYELEHPKETIKDNCYIVDKDGVVLAILTADLTYDLLKQMSDGDPEEKVDSVKNDNTEKIEKLKHKYNITPKGAAVLHVYEYLYEDDKTPLTNEELKLLLEAAIDQWRN